MSPSEICNLFENYEMGCITPFSFIKAVAFHNANAFGTEMIDFIEHSNVAVYMFQGKVIIIKLS